jgi:hypothetical protein
VTVTTLHVWRVQPAAVPLALWRVAVDRRRLRRLPGVRFAKVLGTSRGFGPATADLGRWAALVVWDGPTAPLARDGCTLTLRPLASRGRWSGVEPFVPDPRPHEGPLLVLTRARLRARRAPAFWRASGPVEASLGDQPGLLAAFGVGEAPVGLSGTVSVWRNAADAVRFAYRQPEHAAVVARTSRERWYAEELFARFAVLDIAGDRGVIGWRESP